MRVRGLVMMSGEKGDCWVKGLSCRISRTLCDCLCYFFFAAKKKKSNALAWGRGRPVGVRTRLSLGRPTRARSDSRLMT